jgi:flagellar biosynthetic protein FlhB
MAENPEGMEKTEQATSKRLDESRDKGQVAKSMDVTTSVIILLGGMSVFYFGANISNELMGFTRTTFMNLGNIQITELSFIEMFNKLILFMAMLLAPILLFVFAITLFSEIAQVGLKFASKKFTEGLRFKQIINPFGSLKKIFFSSNSIFELVKSIFKLLFIGLIAYGILRSKDEQIISLMEKPFIETATFIFATSFELIWKLGLVYIIIAVADYFYQKWKFADDMKMTKQEVKDEAKQMEGDPQIKSRIRSIMRNKLRQIMMKNVPRADVIITNPTHFAVAIEYKQGQMTAPRVVAKGVDFLAMKIRDIAMENDIPIVENPPLARQIYFNVDIDQEVPEEMYKAVAQVLAYIFSLKERKAV